MKSPSNSTFPAALARFAFAVVRPVEPFGDYFERLGASTRSSAPVLPVCR